jgi:hypothetical protein
MQQQSTTFSGHHHRQKNKTLAGRHNLAGRPSSPVTIIARKKQKKNQNPFLLHRRPAKPNGQTTISGQTQPKKSILMPQNLFLMPQNSFLMPQNLFLGSKTKI